MRDSAKRSAFTMKPSDIVALLELELPGKIKSKNLDALDPFVVIEPGDLLSVCRFLKKDSRLSFEFLNCISGVDYLEPDPKKAPKAGFEPHTEVVYHLSSFANSKPGAMQRFTLKVILPRWKDKKPGESPEVPSAQRIVTCHDVARSGDDKCGELPEVPSVTSLWRAADWHERE